MGHAWVAVPGERVAAAELKQECFLPPLRVASFPTKGQTPLWAAQIFVANPSPSL